MSKTKMDSVNRLWEILIHPGAAIKKLGAEAGLLAPVLIILGINTAMAFLVLPETVAHTSGLLAKQGMTADQIGKGVTSVVITAFLGALVVPPLTWLVHAALLAVFNQVGLARTRFKELFPDGSIAWIPVFLFDAVTTVLTSPKQVGFRRYFTPAFFAWVPVCLGKALDNVLIKTMGFEAGTAVRTSAAVFLPADSGFLFSFLNRMDVFIIWGLVLLVLSGAEAMKKDKKAVSAYIFSVWLVYIGAISWLTSSLSKMGGA